MVYIESYDFDPSYARVIIGKKGSAIQTLRQMTGIQNVFLDTQSSPHKLKVTGVNRSSCQKVYAEIQKRIGAVRPSVPEVVKTVIENDELNLNSN